MSLTGECPRSLSRLSIARAPSSESVNPCTTISPGSFGTSRDSVHTSRLAICFPSERLVAPVARRSLLRTCDRTLGRCVLPWNRAVEREWLMARPTPTHVTTPLQAAIPRKECTVPPEPTRAVPSHFPPANFTGLAGEALTTAQFSPLTVPDACRITLLAGQRISLTAVHQRLALRRPGVGPRIPDSLSRQAHEVDTPLPLDLHLLVTQLR